MWSLSSGTLLESSLLTYCMFSKLKVNTDIVGYLEVKGTTAPDPTFLFDGKPLKIVKEHKYLGVTCLSNGNF